jgi:hypothetical protein
MERMVEQSGEHRDFELETGESLHLAKYPDLSGWVILSYDWSWISGGVVSELVTATVYPQKLGWEKLRFDSAEKARDFVVEEIKNGKVPGKATRRIISN